MIEAHFGDFILCKTDIQTLKQQQMLQSNDLRQRKSAIFPDEIQCQIEIQKPNFQFQFDKFMLDVTYLDLENNQEFQTIDKKILEEIQMQSNNIYEQYKENFDQGSFIKQEQEKRLRQQKKALSQTQNQIHQPNQLNSRSLNQNQWQQQQSFLLSDQEIIAIESYFQQKKFKQERDTIRKLAEIYRTKDPETLYKNCIS